MRRSTSPFTTRPQIRSIASSRRKCHGPPPPSRPSSTSSPTCRKNCRRCRGLAPLHWILMMKLRTALILTLALTASLSARQSKEPSGADAWIVEPAAGATSAVAYLTVNNPTMYDIYVMSATSSAAEKIELKQGTGAAAKDVSSITVSSYGSAELKAGGEHLVLVNLKRPLKAGDTVDLTLMTDGGAKIVVSAAV